MFVRKRKSNSLIILLLLFLFADKYFNVNEILLAAVEVVSLQFHGHFTEISLKIYGF